MELLTPPWYRRWSVILAGVSGVAAITPPPTSLQTRAPTTRPPEPLWSETGSDPGGKSPGFRASGRWRIEWSFDCGNFRRYGGGNFKITGDGAFQRVEIQDFAVKANGKRELPSGGYGHLLVDSVCRTWTVTVTDA